MSDEESIRVTAISTPTFDVIGKEAQRGQQWALNTPLPTPIAAAAPEVPPPAPATPSPAND